MLVTGFGMITGKWQNNITKEEYLILIQGYGFITVIPQEQKQSKKFNEDALNNNR
jgi:hypothetical protein